MITPIEVTRWLVLGRVVLERTHLRTSGPVQSKPGERAGYHTPIPSKKSNGELWEAGAAVIRCRRQACLVWHQTRLQQVHLTHYQLIEFTYMNHHRGIHGDFISLTGGGISQ
jgi:hypothetical protein